MERPLYVHAFIDSYLSSARSVELFFRIPVSVTLAYAAIESDWGRSALAKKGIIFGQCLKQEDATGADFVEVTQIINKREKVEYFKKTTVREAFLAYAEKLQTNPLFTDAYRYSDNPERFLEVIANGFPTAYEQDRAQLARTTLREFKLKEFDLWLYVDAILN